MIIWQGRGFLVLGVVLLATLVIQGSVEAFFSRAVWEANRSGVWALALVVSAGGVWLLAQRMRDPGRELVDPATGETVLLRRQDSFFFVPVRYWPLILLIGAFIAVLEGIFSGNL